MHHFLRKLLGRKPKAPSSALAEAEQILVDCRPQTPVPQPFDLKRVLAGIIFHQNGTIDVYYPDNSSENRVVDTHTGPLTRGQSKAIAQLLIDAAAVSNIELAWLVALTYVNARWSPEAYDHGFHSGAPGFSFWDTRWGIGLFYGRELCRRAELRGHTEGYILERAADPAWSIPAIATELGEHLEWAQDRPHTSYTWHTLDELLVKYGVLADITPGEKELWLASAAFYLRDRDQTLEIICMKVENPSVIGYCTAVIELTRKFRPQLTEPSA